MTTTAFMLNKVRNYWRVLSKRASWSDLAFKASLWLPVGNRRRRARCQAGPVSFSNFPSLTLEASGDLSSPHLPTNPQVPLLCQALFPHQTGLYALLRSEKGLHSYRGQLFSFQSSGVTRSPSFLSSISPWLLQLWGWGSLQDQAVWPFRKRQKRYCRLTGHLCAGSQNGQGRSLLFPSSWGGRGRIGRKSDQQGGTESPSGPQPVISLRWDNLCWHVMSTTYVLASFTCSTSSNAPNNSVM